MAITDEQHYREALSHLRAASMHADAVGELTAADLIGEVMRILLTRKVEK